MFRSPCSPLHKNFASLLCLKKLAEIGLEVSISSFLPLWLPFFLSRSIFPAPRRTFDFDLFGVRTDDLYKYCAKCCLKQNFSPCEGAKLTESFATVHWPIRKRTDPGFGKRALRPPSMEGYYQCDLPDDSFRRTARTNITDLRHSPEMRRRGEGLVVDSVEYLALFWHLVRFQIMSPEFWSLAIFQICEWGLQV